MNSNRVIALGIAGVVLALGLSALLLQMRRAGGAPLVGTAPGSLAAQRDRLDRILARPDEREIRLNRARAALEALEDECRLAEQLFPRHLEADAWQDEVRRAAVAAGVDATVLDVLPGDEPGRGGFAPWLMRLEVRGQYDAVARFVNAVERLDDPEGTAPRFVEIAAFALDAGMARITLRTYVARDGDGEAPFDPNAPGLVERIADRSYRYEDGGRDPLEPVPPARPETVAAIPELKTEPEPAPEPVAAAIPQPAALPETPAPVAPLAPVAPVEPIQAPQPPVASAHPLEAALAAMAGAAEQGRYADAIGVAESALRAARSGTPTPREETLLAEVLRYRDDLLARRAVSAEPLDVVEPVEPVEPVAAPEALPAPPPGLRLEGVSWSPDNPRAVINGRIYGVGDAVDGHPGVVVDAIARNGVVLNAAGRRQTLGVTMFAP